MTTVVTIAAILCSIAFAVAIGAVVRGRAQDGPDWGLAVFREDRGHLDDAPVEGCDCEDCTEDDPMDAYMEQRAAGNGVLPAEVKVPPKIHYKCADFQLDGEPSMVCPDCAPLLEGVKPVVTRG